MRLASMLLGLLLLGSLAQAQSLGRPGTATPQPYAQPQLRTAPVAPRSSPPLLVNPSRPSRAPAVAPQPLPRDQPLPQLKSGWERSQNQPAEAIGKP